MKKTYSESELKGLAEKVFEQHPNQNEVFATSDGNVFLVKNRAELHAGPKGNIYPFKREAIEEKKTPAAPKTPAAAKNQPANKKPATTKTTAPAKTATAEKTTSAEKTTASDTASVDSKLSVKQ